MNLNELTTPYHLYPAIYYASDYNTALYKNKRLHHVADNLYCTQPKRLSQYSDESTELFVYYPEVPAAIRLGCVTANKSLEDATRYIAPYPTTMPEMLDNLHARIAANDRISNLELKLIELAAPELLEAAKASRQTWMDRRDAEKAAKKAAWEAEQAARIEEEQTEFERTISAALKTIRDGGNLKNEQIIVPSGNAYESGTRQVIILVLLDRYKIKVPPRTRAWIRDALRTVTFQDGEAVSYRRNTRYGRSDAVWKYLNALADAVIAQEA